MVGYLAKEREGGEGGGGTYIYLPIISADGLRRAVDLNLLVSQQFNLTPAGCESCMLIGTISKRNSHRGERARDGR